MQQLFLDKSNLVVKQMVQPLLDDYSLLIAVHYTYISSGTRRAHVDGEESLLTTVPHKVKQVLQAVSFQKMKQSIPTHSDGTLNNKVFSLGYSCSGRVIAVGKKVTRFSLGDLVACADSSYNMHADLACVSEHLVVKIMNKDNLKAASLTSVSAVALQGVRRAQLQLGERVGVFGLGLLGQITIQLLKQSGCIVYAIDSTPERMKLAAELGADRVFHISEDPFKKEIDLITERNGVDTTFITTSTKSDQLIDDAMDITREKGKIVIVGDVGVKIDHDKFYAKSLDILSCPAYEQFDQKNPTPEQHDCSYHYKRWTANRNMEACLQLIESGKLKVEPLMKETITVRQIKKAYDLISKKRAVGLVLSYEHEPYGLEAIKALQPTKMYDFSDVFTFKPAVSDTIRVGFMGISPDAQKYILPVIAKQRNVSIDTIVDANTRNVVTASKKYNRLQVCSFDELCENALIDAVVIASSDVLHAEQARQVFAHGKAIFLEKPCVTDFDQLYMLTTLLDRNPNAPLCVNYSQTFAPFTQKIKKVLNKRITPLMIRYRLNIGHTSQHERIRPQAGSGRIVSDMCQVVDMLCFLVDSQPVSVAVESIKSSRNDVFPTDNFNAHISFADGSVVSICCSSLGHPDLGSERMELFYDEKSIVMEDYTELYGFGLPSWFNETATTPDRGVEAIVSEFFYQIKQEVYTPPIPFDRIKMGAYVTLLIDQLACEGGGKKDVTSEE